MDALQKIDVNPENAWRLEAPPPQGWARDVQAGPGREKYFMISVDSHLAPPPKLFKERMDRKWHDKLPRIEVRDGAKYLVMEGLRDERLIDTPLSGEDLVRSQSGAIVSAAEVHEKTGLQRIADQQRDGIDGEVIFPNGPALLMWSSSDIAFVKAQCAAWNDWVWEACGPYSYFCNPAAALATADIEASVKEVERVARMGFRTLTLPCKPVWGAHDITHLNYNLPAYDPLWAAIQDHDLAATFHVSTGKDPRGARGNGGAIINFVVHSLAPTIEPIVNLCSSGVFERFPKLRVATIEANAGWIPWMLEAMDEGYRKHHMWVRPKLKALPSDYYRSNCFASFAEDHAAMALVERYDLVDNLMWANDYPHHEGSWPHSAEAIRRNFAGGLREETRAKLLGLNAAKMFRFEVPEALR